MKYYLDTNTLYNLKKIPEHLYSGCFYSAFNITEIIAGISCDNFFKRKNILANIKASGMFVDDALPTEKLFNS